jgi:hypothetical protein
MSKSKRNAQKSKVKSWAVSNSAVRCAVILSNVGSGPNHRSALAFWLFLWFVTCRWVIFIFNNSFCFHQYNGKAAISSLLFNNIMERSVSDIFDAFVFNNIMEDTFIFPPRVFSLPGYLE